jgi:hypothetical protein
MNVAYAVIASLVKKQIREKEDKAFARNPEMWHNAVALSRKLSYDRYLDGALHIFGLFEQNLSENEIIENLSKIRSG